MPGTAPGPPGSAGGRRCTLVYAVCGPGHSRPASATAPGGGAGGRTRDVAVGRATESFSEKCSLVSRCSGRVPWVLYRAGGQVIFFLFAPGYLFIIWSWLAVPWLQPAQKGGHHEQESLSYLTPCPPPTYTHNFSSSVVC